MNRDLTSGKWSSRELKGLVICICTYTYSFNFAHAHLQQMPQIRMQMHTHVQTYAHTHTLSHAPFELTSGCQSDTNQREKQGTCDKDQRIKGRNYAQLLAEFCSFKSSTYSYKQSPSQSVFSLYLY